MYEIFLFLNSLPIPFFFCRMNLNVLHFQEESSSLHSDLAIGLVQFSPDEQYLAVVCRFHFTSNPNSLGPFSGAQKSSSISTIEVLSQITYALPIYGASQVADLNTIQCFLKRYNKRRYTSELVSIYDLLEKCTHRLFTKIKNNVNHPLYALLPKVKESSKKLRSQTSQLPRINTESFKNCYFNRIRFKKTRQSNNIDIQCFIRFDIIIVNDLFDFHDLCTFTFCNVCYVF